MSETKQITNLNDAATAYANMLFQSAGSTNWQSAKDDFTNGAEWQKQQDSQLLTLLKGIAEWPGNLSDKVLQSATGPNDAAMRGGIICDMRDIAIEAVRRYEPDYNPLNK